MSPKLARSRPRVVLRASIGTCSNKSIAARLSLPPPRPHLSLHRVECYIPWMILTGKKRGIKEYTDWNFFFSPHIMMKACKCNITVWAIAFASSPAIKFFCVRIITQRGSSMKSGIKNTLKITCVISLS